MKIKSIVLNLIFYYIIVVIIKKLNNEIDFIFLLFISSSAIAGYEECGCSSFSNSGYYSIIKSYSYLSDSSGDCCSSGNSSLAVRSTTFVAAFNRGTPQSTYVSSAEAQSECCGETVQ